MDEVQNSRPIVLESIGPYFFQLWSSWKRGRPGILPQPSFDRFHFLVRSNFFYSFHVFFFSIATRPTLHEEQIKR